MVGVVQFAPQLILSPTSGKWADTGDPARQILLGRVLCVAGSGSAAVWLFAEPGGHDISPRSRARRHLLVGFGFVVGGPAMQSIVPNLIRDGELSTAMALNSIPMTRRPHRRAATGAYWPRISVRRPASRSAPACTWCSRSSCRRALPGPTAARRRGLPRARGRGKYVWRDRPLLLALLAVTTVGFASDPSITLTPSMADELGGGARLVGACRRRSASARRRDGGAGDHARPDGVRPVCRRSGVAGSRRAAGARLTPHACLALAGFAVAGLGFGWAMTGLSTVVQERAPEELRGRIMALWLVGFLGSRPVRRGAAGRHRRHVQRAGRLRGGGDVLRDGRAVASPGQTRGPAACTRVTAEASLVTVGVGRPPRNSTESREHPAASIPGTTSQIGKCRPIHVGQLHERIDPQSVSQQRPVDLAEVVVPFVVGDVLDLPVEFSV